MYCAVVPLQVSTACPRAICLLDSELGCVPHKGLYRLTECGQALVSAEYAVPCWTHNLKEKPAAPLKPLEGTTHAFTPSWAETRRPGHHHGTERAHSNAIQAG